MSAWGLIIIAIGLAMDAFAVALCKGLFIKPSIKNMAVVGLYFGLFQAIMPLIGYLIAAQFADMIISFDHWVAFALLNAIGAKMIYESFKKDSGTEKELNKRESIGLTVMLPLALATSVDALAAGVTFAFLDISILFAVLLIGGVTFMLSAVGVKAGAAFGTKLKSKAELAGGIILILMGIKILIEHLFF